MASASNLLPAAAPALNSLFLVLIMVAGMGGLAVPETGGAPERRQAFHPKAQEGGGSPLDSAAAPVDSSGFAGLERRIALPGTAPPAPGIASPISLAIAGLGLALALLGGGLVLWSLRRIGAAARETSARQELAALRASERRIRAVLDQALDAIVSMDAEERIVGFNAAAETMFGWPRGEALGKRLSEVMIPERFRALHLAGVARAPENGAARMVGRRRELTALRADGAEFPVEISIVANVADGTRIYTAFIRDISARKDAEAARRAAEERLWAFLDGSPEAVSMKDTEGRYMLCNKAFETMTGVSRERLPGLTRDRVFPGQPELHETIRRHEAEVIRSQRPVRQLREWRRRDGQSRSFVAVKFPVFGAEGELVGVGTINQEVTELKSTEAQLRQAQKMQALGLLTGGVAHDFNNLLAVVLGNLELLAERLGDEPQARDLAVAAIGAAQRGAALTQRLLAFARQQPLAPRPVALPALLDGMSDLLPQSLGTGTRLEIRCQPGLWACYVDPAQLETALLNLAINARDAMPEAGTLTIEAANATAETLPPPQSDGMVPDGMVPDGVLPDGVLPDGVLPDGEAPDAGAPGGEGPGGEGPGSEGPCRAVTISVTDTGAGMSPETLERAFEPFFTTKPVGRGSGLGLSMVYGFARQSGGDARIVSAEGRGTRVELWLPAAAAVMARDDEAAMAGNRHGDADRAP